MDMTLYTVGKATNHSRSSKWSQSVTLRLKSGFSPHCSCRGSRINSQHPHGCSQPPETPVSGCPDSPEHPDQRPILGRFPHSFILWKKELLWNRKLTDYVRQAGNELQGLPPQCWKVQADTMPALHGLWESKLRFLCSYCRCFQDWVSLQPTVSILGSLQHYTQQLKYEVN